MGIYGPALQKQAGAQVIPPTVEPEKGSVALNIWRNGKKQPVRLPKDPASFDLAIKSLKKQGFTFDEKDADTFIWDFEQGSPKQVTKHQATKLTQGQPHKYQTMEWMLKEVPISAEERGRIRTRNVRRVDLPKWLAAGWVAGTTTRKEIPVEVKEATKWVLSLARGKQEALSMAAKLEAKHFGELEKALNVPPHLKEIHEKHMAVLRKYYGVEKEKPKSTRGVWNPTKKIIEWQ